MGGHRSGFDWSEKINKLNEFSTFEEVESHVLHNPIPFLDCRIIDSFRDGDEGLVDLVALHYRPSDCPDYMVPCHIFGDSNCFPCCLSLICFHTEDHHVEMRVRLVYEGVQNWRQYINNRYMNKGASIVRGRGGSCEAISLYSSAYAAENYNIQNVFQAEILEIRKPGAWCGLWQLAEAANVLHRPVKSVFPDMYTINMRKDFDREFLCLNNAYNSRPHIYLMWTAMHVSERNQQTGHETCQPNHFVPLLSSVR